MHLHHVLVAILLITGSGGANLPAQAAPTQPQTSTTQAFLSELKAMNPRIGTLRQLVSQGADINARSDDGFPALHLAVWRSWKALKLLVAMGADINAQDRKGDTALAAATEMGAVEIVDLLLKEGANPNIRNANGRTSLGKARYMMTRPAETSSQSRLHRIIADYLQSTGAKE